MSSTQNGFSSKVIEHWIEVSLNCVSLEQFCFQKNFSFDSRLAAEQLILDQESKEKTGKKTIKDFSHKLQFCFCFVSSVQYIIMSLGLDLIILVVFQY